jgi:hypothetical protein
MRDPLKGKNGPWVCIDCYFGKDGPGRMLVEEMKSVLINTAHRYVDERDLH